MLKAPEKSSMQKREQQCINMREAMKEETISKKRIVLLRVD